MKEKIISKLDEITHFSQGETVYIRDTMAMIQTLNPAIGKSCIEVADSFADGIMKGYEHADINVF